MVCHDDDIARTSNGQGCISQMTLAQLRQYDFGSKFAPEFAGTPIPTLEEFLQVVSDMNPINIEIKGPFREDTDLKGSIFLDLYPAGKIPLCGPHPVQQFRT